MNSQLSTQIQNTGGAGEGMLFFYAVRESCPNIHSCSQLVASCGGALELNHRYFKQNDPPDPNRPGTED